MSLTDQNPRKRQIARLVLWWLKWPTPKRLQQAALQEWAWFL
jgi:hypothetical protein